LRDKSTPPYKYKGSRPIRYPIDQINTTFIFLLSFFPSFFTSTICCSSFVSTSIEGVLGGLPTLEQPCVRLPRRVLPGRRLLVSPPACPVTTGLTSLSIGATLCRRSLRVQAFSCVSPSSAPTPTLLALLLKHSGFRSDEKLNLWKKLKIPSYFLHYFL